MDMKLIEQILTIGASIVSLVVFVVSVVFFIINKVKKHQNGEVESESQDVLKLVQEIIPFAISFAEHAGVYNGNIKKMLCLSEVLLKCQNANIDYGKYEDFISDEVEKQINFTKEVNAKPSEEEISEAVLNTNIDPKTLKVLPPSEEVKESGEVKL